MTLEPAQLDAQGKKAFNSKKFTEAAELFRKAAEGYSLGRAGLLAAEMRNNMSVALLQAGKPQEALDAALGTDEIFAGAQDIKRQGMALGNIAAALHELKRDEEALEKYDLAAELFAQVNEDDLRSVVKKAAASIRFTDGKVTDAAFNMIGSLDAKKNPTIVERILKFLLSFVK
jgi:tetratricopeptide (TPR) repeat protein